MLRRCAVCSADLTQAIEPWHWICRDCGTEQSCLSPAIDSTTKVKQDEDRRAVGLAALRARGAEVVLAELHRIRGRSGGSILEVGSAHGWFLAVAAKYFEVVVGIEPDHRVRRVPEHPKVRVRGGYFPQALIPGETFDVVVFNDVFEHIPDARASVSAVAKLLKPGGIAVVNLPVNGGAVYRIAKIMCSIGLRAPFRRLWQLDFPSPHLYYFSSLGLNLLYSQFDFECLKAVPMPTITVRGLWERITYAKNNPVFAAMAYLFSLAFVPLERMLPADVKCFYFRSRV